MRTLFALVAILGIAAATTDTTTPPAVTNQPQAVAPKQESCPNCQSKPCRCIKTKHYEQKQNEAPDKTEAIPRSNAVVSGPEYSGKQVTVDLVARMHLKNKGGSDGAGLCVFTSVNHSSEYGNCDELRGLRDYMTRFPGGGYPEKLDKVIKAYCDSRSMKVPPYLQHTGGDVAFLKECLAAGRMPSVTYGGADGVYYRGDIYHMVNLVYLDDKVAAILDNNFPGQYLWMDVGFFLNRWRFGSGGWAVVVLTPPPPPPPSNSITLVQDCPNGKCPNQPVEPYFWREDIETPNQLNLYKGNRQFGALRLKDNKFYWAKGNGIWVEGVSPIEAPKQEETITNYGVDFSKVDKNLSIKNNFGEELRWDKFCEVVGKSYGAGECVHLTFVGDETTRKEFRKLVTTLPLDKSILIQEYDPNNWAVTEIGLPLGLTYQTASGAVIWRSDKIPTTEALIEGLRKRNPDYAPNKDKSLDNPSPITGTAKIPLWLLALVGVGGYLLLVKKKEQ